MEGNKAMKTPWFLAVCCIAVGLVPGWLWAYVLTEADYQTLKNDILVTHAAEFAVDVANNADQNIADKYNLQAVPPCWVWRTAVPERDNYEVTTDLPSTWDWDIFPGLQPNIQTGWVRMFATGALNASLDNNRAALPKIFKGAPASAQITHVLAVWRRQALRGEVLYVTPQTG